SDVRHQTAAEKRRDASFRPVEELVGNQQIERTIYVFQRADRARREDVLHAKLLEAEDVGAEVQLAWKDAMSDSVTGEKGHLLTAQGAGHVGGRWFAEGSGKSFFAAAGQLRHVVETAAANDADRC